MDPLAETANIVLDSEQHGTSTMDKHPTQVDVAPLADAVQFCVSAGRVLSRYKAEPGCEITPFAKGRSVADRGDRGRGHQRPNSGDLSQALAGCIFLGDAFDLRADNGDVILEVLPLLPYLVEQHTHPRGDVLLGIFEDGRYAVAQVLPALWRRLGRALAGSRGSG